jgi:ABC-type polar amino acid transport system ATPase subunit
MHNMGKRFGSTTVLRGIHLDIVTGEVVAVIGRSDSGKSTLSRRSIKPSPIEALTESLWNAKEPIN